ncbi:MAG: ribose ABC transporter permease [Cyclobacteriaceae bacterium]|nr:ribose ABC transporter permease [Cyclobacteriaceae bacterium]
MANKGVLLKELFTNIHKTGAVTFSSPALVKKMVSYADLKGAKTIVEFGGGDGSITSGIYANMDPDAELFVFEINKSFCENLSKDFPYSNVKIICDSAENLDHYLQDKKASYIFSSLPLTLIHRTSREKIYQRSSSSLDEKGKFIQICYSYFLKFHFRRYFKQVRTIFTLKNFPPIFIMICN